eukprot:scaffold80671_cov33-Tisochrysis_lutea.AAC.1
MLFNVGDAIPDEPQIARAAVLPSRRQKSSGRLEANWSRGTVRVTWRHVSDNAGGSREEDASQTVLASLGVLSLVPSYGLGSVAMVTAHIVFNALHPQVRYPTEG